MKQFYTHLITLESINIEIDKMNLPDEERLHLAYLIDSSLHHTILDAVLSQLENKDKRMFMIYLRDGNHDKLWKFLNEKVDQLEDKIKKAADDLKDELHKDLKEARNKT